MTAGAAVRCRHAFEAATVHANGEVVCSIIDGRGDFVLGNVHQESLPDILSGARARELRRLMLSAHDAYCPAIGKRCALKTIPVDVGAHVPTTLRFLAIEPTTACDLRCLTCPVRDFSGDVTWRHAYRDGGAFFLIWDALRRGKQHAADYTRHVLPSAGVDRSSRTAAFLRRGRIPASRRGTLPIQVLKQVVSDAGPAIERIDLFNYGEPFLYRHLIEALRHIRSVSPSTTLAISTDGMQVSPAVEDVIVAEQLVDWLIFSVDGCDENTYRRYRIRGRFDVAFANLARFHRRAAGTRVKVIWQYVVFKWNDADAHFSRAIKMAADLGVPIWFDFAHTWGRSRRHPAELRYLTPYLRPFTALPGEPRQEGW